MEKTVTELRGPEADALRQACIKSADRISALLGHPASAHCVNDWVRVRDVWRMSWVWLLPAEGKDRLEPGEEAAHNIGFRVLKDPQRCAIETWGVEGATSFSQNGWISESRAEAYLEIVFAAEE
jgi:hypothetical protein